MLYATEVGTDNKCAKIYIMYVYIVYKISGIKVSGKSLVYKLYL